MIKITSRVPGFRRAGIEHPGTPVVYPKDQFTPEQLRALKNEPMLIVEELELPDDGGQKVETSSVKQESDKAPSGSEDGGQKVETSSVKQESDKAPSGSEDGGQEGDPPESGDGKKEDKPKPKGKKRAAEDKKDGGQG